MATAEMTLRRRIVSGDCISLILDFAWTRHTRDLKQLAFDGNYQVIQQKKYRDLFSACKGGHHDIVDLMIKNGATDWDYGLEGACCCGHRDLVDLMIKNGATAWNWGLIGACRGGHRDLVDLMIKNGATYWNWGLEGACEGGHHDVVDLMI